jgi:hypothetical protein
MGTVPRGVPASAAGAVAFGSGAPWDSGTVRIAVLAGGLCYAIFLIYVFAVAGWPFGLFLLVMGGFGVYAVTQFDQFVDLRRGDEAAGRPSDWPQHY